MLELLLVLAVLILLAGVIWTNLDARSSAGKLEFAARQLGTMLQLARSEAMTMGKSYRCRFESDGMRAVLEEEADPIKQPGTFVVLKAHWAQVDLGGPETIKCLSVHFDPWESQLKEQEAKVVESDDESERRGPRRPSSFIRTGRRTPWSFYSATARTATTR
jgi:type II secretory pathway pseudopilin PulG